MKKQTRKLALQLDTIRHLNDDGLRAAAGGAPTHTLTESDPPIRLSRIYCG